LTSFNFRAQLHEEYLEKTRIFHEASWASITRSMSGAVSIQAALHLKLGKIAAQAAREGVAAYIESQGKKWAADAAAYGFQALAFLALGDFRGAAQMGAAVRGSIRARRRRRGRRGCVAAHAIGGPVGRTRRLRTEETSGGRGIGSRSTVDLTQRTAPEVVTSTSRRTCREASSATRASAS